MAPQPLKENLSSRGTRAQPA